MSLYIIIGVVVFLATVWATVDAFERTPWGCVWLFFFCAAPGVSLIVYLFLRLATDRAVGQQQLLREEFNQPTFSRFPTEIEKARFIEASAQGGTMYEPDEPSQFRQGFLHFRDEQVERKLREKRYDEVAGNLAELYLAAREENNNRALDTYRHYIAQLPGGMARVIKLVDELAVERESHQTPVVDNPKRPPGSRKPGKDIPF